MGRPLTKGYLDRGNETSLPRKSATKEEISISRAVTMIPATKNKFTALPTTSIAKRRTTGKLAYYNAFDEYHNKNSITAMEKIICKIYK